MQKANPFTMASQHRKYDAYESRAGNFGFCARHLAKLLAEKFPPMANGLLYDFGCGTGNSTAQLLEVFKKATVVGLDVSPDMLQYAKVKFGFADDSQMVRELVSENDMQLAFFIKDFRKNACSFRLRALFAESDLLGFRGEPADGAIGSQFFHWVQQQEMGAEKLNTLLKKGACIALSSAAMFYKSSKFPDMASVYYVQHPAVQHYFDVLGKKIDDACGKQWKGLDFSRRKDPGETIALFESKGFEMVKYDEVPTPKIKSSVIFEYSLRMAPDHLGMFDNTLIQEGQKEQLINDAILETVSKKSSSIPNMVPSDLMFVFMFRKKPDC